MRAGNEWSGGNILGCVGRWEDLRKIVRRIIFSSPYTLDMLVFSCQIESDKILYENSKHIVRNNIYDKKKLFVVYNKTALNIYSEYKLCTYTLLKAWFLLIEPLITRYKKG